MNTIWKFPLKALDVQKITAPEGAECIHVAEDSVGELCLWLLVDTEAPLETFLIFILGTGQSIPPGVAVFLGSHVMGSFVWHVFSGPLPDTD